MCQYNFKIVFILKKEEKEHWLKYLKKQFNEEFFNKVKTKIMEIRKYKIIVK